MRTYESLFITPPTLSEEEENSVVEGFARVIDDGGGSMVANERLGRRRLAYPLRKHSDGVYVRFLYDAEAQVPRELERKMRLSDNVLRVLTVRLDRDLAVEAKEQAVRDAQERVDAAEREKERLEQERVAAAAGLTAASAPQQPGATPPPADE